MNHNHQLVAVYGAYGHTAAFVLREMDRRDLIPVLVGRDHDRLRARGRSYPRSPVRTASVNDPAALDRALAGTAAVVNCAGPFTDTAPALVNAALRARVPYLDVGAEQAVALETFRVRQERARSVGVPLLPSLAFYGGLGDLLATTAMGDWPRADGIDIAFALDSWKPTAGTRATGRRNAGRHMVYAGGRFVTPPRAPETTVWNFPGPTGTQEVTAFSTADQVTVSHHLRTRDIRAHMNQAPLRDLGDPATPAPEPVDDSGRSAQTFLVDVVAHRGGEQRRASASGRDIYAVTGPLVVEATARLLEGRVREGSGGGVFAAGGLFDAENFLRALSPEHLDFASHSDSVIGT